MPSLPQQRGERGVFVSWDMHAGGAVGSQTRAQGCEPECHRCACC